MFRTSAIATPRMTWMTTLENAQNRLKKSEPEELEVRDRQLLVSDLERSCRGRRTGRAGFRPRKFLRPKSVNDIQTWKNSG